MTIDKSSFSSADADAAHMGHSESKYVLQGMDGGSKSRNVFSENTNFNRMEERANRPRHQSKRVPNLLSGVPLLPGPVTPNFVPMCSPESTGFPQYQSVAMFPSFMLAPSVLTGESFPGLTNLPGMYPGHDTRRSSRKKPVPADPVLDSNLDFPELNPTKPLLSSKKLSPVKFPRNKRIVP